MYLMAPEQTGWLLKSKSSFFIEKKNENVGRAEIHIDSVPRL